MSIYSPLSVVEAMTNGIIKNYWNKKEKGAYIRRYKEDYRGKRGDALFESIEKDGVIKELTDGVYDGIKYQSGRWYFWQVNSYAELSPVGNESDVSRQSANNHLIPSNDEIRKQIAKIKTGDHVIITGYLVDIRAEKDNGDYKIWKTSTSREDVGGGSCEIIYVTGIQIL